MRMAFFVKLITSRCMLCNETHLRKIRVDPISVKIFINMLLCIQFFEIVFFMGFNIIMHYITCDPPLSITHYTQNHHK